MTMRPDERRNQLDGFAIEYGLKLEKIRIDVNQCMMRMLEELRDQTDGRISRQVDMQLRSLNWRKLAEAALGF